MVASRGIGATVVVPDTVDTGSQSARRALPRGRVYSPLLRAMGSVLRSRELFIIGLQSVQIVCVALPKSGPNGWRTNLDPQVLGIREARGTWQNFLSDLHSTPALRPISLLLVASSFSSTHSRHLVTKKSHPKICPLKMNSTVPSALVRTLLD